MTSGNRSKSKFPPVVIQTTDLPLIDCPKSCNASIERAPAGSRTIPSTFSISNIVIHTLSSGALNTLAKPIDLRVSKGLFPICPTAAPSAKVSTLSRGTGLPAINAAQSDAPPRGSINEYWELFSKYLRTPAESPPPPTGITI